MAIEDRHLLHAMVSEGRTYHRRWYICAHRENLGEEGYSSSIGFLSSFKTSAASGSLIVSFRSDSTCLIKLMVSFCRPDFLFRLFDFFFCCHNHFLAFFFANRKGRKRFQNIILSTFCVWIDIVFYSTILARSILY